MRFKKSKGFTMAELLVAIAVLAIVSAPILNLFSASAKISAASNQLTEISITAQAAFEQVSSSNLDVILAEGGTTDLIINGYPVKASLSTGYTVNGVHLPRLAELCVEVFDDSNQLLYTLEGIVNMSVGGV